MSLYDKVFSHNKEWVQQQLQLDPAYFSDMAKSQAPDFLYIGCSDSRVSPDAFMGVKPGDVFIHRNIANLVPNNDISSLAVLQYASRACRLSTSSFVDITDVVALKRPRPTMILGI